MTQYLDWKVGDPVVCIDDTPGVFGGGNLTKGSVYTLSAIERVAFAPHVGVQVAEVKYRWYEFASAARFRKVQPRKTSIALFERLLNTQNNEVETA